MCSFFIKFLARFFPCLTSPCRNGGTCASGSELEVFSCDCPLEIKALPYIDDKCNVGKFGNWVLKYAREYDVSVLVNILIRTRA